MKLLEKFKIGHLELENKIVMAPMTRCRANDKGIVSDITVTYYSQRASAGLIISEGINISEQAQGSPFTPGIYNHDQIDAWNKVTSAVHEKGGKIFAQLWHTGRVGHSVDKKGVLPVAPSSIAISGQTHFTSQGVKEYETPRALEIEEIKQIIQDYKNAALNAMEAGFDGVELHAAFGYLPNQFLVESANQRIDEYGGSVANRCRFILEIMQEMTDALGSNKVGIKLSPSIPFNTMIDSNPVELYSHLIDALDKMPLACIHLMNALFPLEKLPQYPKDVIGQFSNHTKHPIIANGAYNRESGEEELNRGLADLISYGSLFISNPDLPLRFKMNRPLAEADRSTFYFGGEKGYIDYPFESE
jgi:N-ethylmaleimide reductase